LCPPRFPDSSGELAPERERLASRSKVGARRRSIDNLRLVEIARSGRTSDGTPSARPLCALSLVRTEVLMKRVLVGSFLVLVGTYGTAAQAQEVSEQIFERQMAAPAQAFEIGVSGLYNQGWGNLTDTQSALNALGRGRHLQDFAGPGVGVEVDLGFR